MKKTDRMGFHGKMLYAMIVPGLALLALLLTFPETAGARGDQAGDAKIQAMKSDIMACMQPGDAGKKAREAFAKKYNVSVSKVNEKFEGKKSASAGTTDWHTVCWVEVWLTVGGGAAVWSVRRDWDGYKGSDPINYCTEYSVHCDHYDWSRDCLKYYQPACCY